MSYTIEAFEEILSSADLTGFTDPLKGKPGRYIVGLTNNSVWSLEILVAQAKHFDQLFSTLTLGGRRNPKTDVVFIDIGTTSDSWSLAKSLSQFYDQRCVWDSVECVSIPI